MFRTALCRAVSPAMLFVKQNKGKFTGPARYTNTWNAYRALNKYEKKLLTNKAEETQFRHSKFFNAKKEILLKRRNAHVKSFGKHPYATFTAANYKKVAHLPASKRFKAIAKLWKEAKLLKELATNPGAVTI
jgi:hypothetical protein